MNIPIKTNKLNYTLNKDRLSKEYDLFCIQTSEKYFKSGAYIIDAPLNGADVRSVVFDSGKSIYALMSKNENNRNVLGSLLRDAKGGEYVTLIQMDFDSMPDRYLLQLLINSLANYSSEALRFNNLTGHFYCFHPNWLVSNRIGGVSEIVKVPCMELRVTDDYRLALPIATFTSEKLKSKIVFKKKQFHQYPKYVFAANNTLRRKLADDTDVVYIKRQTEGKKTSIPFLKIGSLYEFEQSKMGCCSQFSNASMKNSMALRILNLRRSRIMYQRIILWMCKKKTKLQ